MLAQLVAKTGNKMQKRNLQLLTHDKIFYSNVMMICVGDP